MLYVISDRGKKIYLFSSEICGLFSDAVSSSVSIASNDEHGTSLTEARFLTTRPLLTQIKTVTKCHGLKDGN
jgi:hypothetical protein